MTLDDLQHPDCRACEERKRLSLGQITEIKALKGKLRGDGSDPLDDRLVELKAKESDCGVCGVPAFCMVEVCEGYAVPRCEDHREVPAYQAESRLHSLLELASTPRLPQDGGQE